MKKVEILQIEQMRHGKISDGGFIKESTLPQMEKFAFAMASAL